MGCTVLSVLAPSSCAHFLGHSASCHNPKYSPGQHEVFGFQDHFRGFLRPCHFPRKNRGVFFVDSHLNFAAGNRLPKKWWSPTVAMQTSGSKSVRGLVGRCRASVFARRASVGWNCLFFYYRICLAYWCLWLRHGCGQPNAMNAMNHPQNDHVYGWYENSIPSHGRFMALGCIIPSIHFSSIVVRCSTPTNEIETYSIHSIYCCFRPCFTLIISLYPLHLSLATTITI